MARALATTILLLLSACTERARPAAVLRPAAVPRPAPAAPPPPALELSKAAPAEPVQLSIVEPESGQTLALADAATTTIKVHAARPDWILELALDGQRARPTTTLPEAPTLGDLNDGAPLAAGAHYLVAALRASEDHAARFAVARFSIETKVSDQGPLVYCARPAGTYFGDADGTLLLDFAVDGFEPGPNGAVRVRARSREPSEPVREALLREGGPKLIRGIGPGDWSIELDLLGPANRPLDGQLSRHRCELTLNQVAEQ